MNKHLHRIIFNAKRGQRMAVAESASSCGKATGSTQSCAASRSASLCGATFPSLKALSVAVFCALGGFAQWLPVAQAQVVADPSAPGNQRPTVLTAPNGVPLQNITTPSGAGVSINQLSLFNVGPHGVILNNSRTNAQTQLGGWVQGNPWLATGSARKIVNQINSSSPSYINGYIEVAGQRAEVIIANPSGININGGGFINASRATLTTGTPIIKAGNLEGYVVQKGLVRIDGAGLDSSRTDFTGIIARAVEVNAGIWANDFKVTTGANQVDEAQTSATPIAGSGAAPAFALDVALLGGMYAGKITLVGTEGGVGVRNAGVIGASAGDLVLQTNGWLTNSGSIQASGNAQIQSSGSMANSGLVSASQTLALATPGALDNSGGTLNAQRLDVSAASLGNRGGTIEQTGIQALSLQSQSLSNAAGGHIGQTPASTGTTPAADGTGSTGGTGASGTTGTGATTGQTTPGTPGTPGAPGDTAAGNAAQAVVLQSGALRISGPLNNDAGRISAAGPMDLSSHNGLNNDAGTLSLRQLHVASGDVSNQGGSLRTQGDMRIQAGQLNNQGGSLTAHGPLQIAAASLNNRQGDITQGGGADTTLQVSASLDNNLGRIATNGQSLTLAANTLSNVEGKIEHAAGRDATGQPVGTLAITATTLN
uniref:two-partner secretion domain-containing protein n=1 Tax=Polaromonas sp. TaxID=1869339 RepID=UPI001854DF4D